MSIDRPLNENKILAPNILKKACLGDFKVDVSMQDETSWYRDNSFNLLSTEDTYLWRFQVGVKKRPMAALSIFCSQHDRQTS